MRARTTELPTVLIFATGGTIGMHDTGRGLEPDPAFPEILEQTANAYAASLGYRVKVNLLQPAIDSANADEETAPKIARALRARIGASSPRGVVVLHGTDTLAYTAARLAFELSGLTSPVVVTGSQFPHGAEGTDAFDNLRLAIRTSTQASPGAPVSVAFGGKVIPAIRATKFDADHLSAFRAERQLAPTPRGLPRPPKVTGEVRLTNARVLSYRFTPATTARDLLAAVGGEPDALVLECFGAGNAPMAKPGMTDALRQIGARMPMVAITQCTVGTVNTDRYAVGRQFAAAGVISGHDLTLEAAIAKLGYLIDSGFDREHIDALMTANLVGECTE